LDRQEFSFLSSHVKGELSRKIVRRCGKAWKSLYRRSKSSLTIREKKVLGELNIKRKDDRSILTSGDTTVRLVKSRIFLVHRDQCSIKLFGHTKNIVSNVLRKIEENALRAFYHCREIVWLSAGKNLKDADALRSNCIRWDRISRDLRLFDWAFCRVCHCQENFRLLTILANRWGI